MHLASTCRLENGLNKLHKTQSEVDVLVENARAMALDVEQKVASANVFAEQVRGWLLSLMHCIRPCKGAVQGLGEGGNESAGLLW